MLHADTKRTPASLTKLFTGATALHFYPPHHRFITYLSSTGQLNKKSQTLHGDLFLVGQGDPSFTSELMWNLVNRFHHLSIKNITGNLIVDDTYFSEALQSEIDKKGTKDNKARSYNAPSSALSFNWNTVNIFIRPNEKMGQKAYVHLDPINRYILLKGHIQTVSSSGRKKIHIQRIATKNNDEPATIFVRGQIPKNHPEVVVYKNITKPALWAGHNLKEFLRQRGISIQGKVLKGKEPEQSVPLSMVKGKTITQIVTDMNKFSNNFVAEMLLKNMVIAQEKNLTNSKNSKSPKSPNFPSSKISHSSTSESTSSNKIAIIKAFLSQIGINKKKFHLVDPSGLSKKNKLSAFTIYKLLSFLYHRSLLRHEFISSLPIAGMDGTLSDRFKKGSHTAYQEPQAPLIRAKTGSLTGVVGLAGYAQEVQENETFLFVLIYNGPAGKEYKAQKLFDFISHILTLRNLN